MSPKLRPVIALAVIAIGGGAWWFLSKGDPNADLTLYGNVDIRQVDLAFTVDGALREMSLEEGDAVRTGQIAAKLDAAPYEHALAQSEANAAQARAVLAKAEAGSRSQEIDSVRATVTEARARLQNAEAVMKRRQDLERDSNVSRQALDDARRDVDVARATLNSREATLKLAVEGLRSEDIDAARAALKAAEAGAALAKYHLDQATLIVPGDGTIVTRVREPGSVVNAGATVFSLALSNPVWVRTYVNEPYLGRTAPGTKVTITTDDPAGKSYGGTIGFVSPTAEFTPKAVETPELRTSLVYRLRVVVDDPDSGLRQGMPVTVTVNHVP